MSLIAIIVAGGSGTRMGTRIKKQYLPLAGAPVMGYALRALDRAHEVEGLVLVVPKEDLTFMENEILPNFSLQKELLLVSGGHSRQESVSCGLRALPSATSMVLVHDAVRPFPALHQITQVIEAAKIHGAASLAIPVTDTLRRQTDDGKSEAIPRENVFAMQTPQVFRVDLLKRAHEYALLSGISGTDDAGLVASMGGFVTLVQGSRSNIKITEKEDLLLAEALLKAGI